MRKNENELMKMNLQFFAEGDESTGTEETGADDKGADTGKNDKGTGDEGKKEKTFTQAEVTAMMAKEKREGKNSVLKQLGLEEKDLKGLKTLIESQKTDEQKAAEEKAKTLKEKTEAENRAMVAEAKLTAISLGANVKDVDDVVTLAIAKSSEDKDFKTVIEELKKSHPSMFTTEQEDKGGKGKAGSSLDRYTKGTSTSSSKGEDEELSLGARLAANSIGARKQGQENKSYYFKR